MNFNSSSPSPSPSLSFSSSSSTTTRLVNSELSSASITTGITTSANASSSKLNANKKSTAMEAFLNSIGNNIVPNSTTGSRVTIIEELHNYRSLVDKYNIQNSPSTSSCLTFWKTYEFMLPYLFKLAKKFVCTSATSVPAEAAFSVSSYVFKKERSRLSVKNLEAIVFLKVSIKYT